MGLAVPHVQEKLLTELRRYGQFIPNSQLNSIRSETAI